MTETVTPAVSTELERSTGSSATPAGRTGKVVLTRTVKYVLLLLFVIVVLMPVYVLIVTSLKPPADVNPESSWGLPLRWPWESVNGGPTGFDNWAVAWDALAASIGRTFLLAIPAALISAMLGSMNGFVLSRWRFPHASLVFTLILFGMFIPYQAIMTPLVEMKTALGMPSNIVTLLIVHIIYGLPICTLIFRNYYEGVPVELMEASRVDGAGMLRSYWSIILPLSLPGFVVTIIWQFTSAWNDFLFAMFLSDVQGGPVSLSLNNLAQGAQLANYGAAMAGALLASLPTLVVYIILGKYFIGGLMSGSVKS
ncbi:carbohydrate ABC transporter membrane protein 2, CUT1 family [Paramicrobacterium humi]|uniref:Carbohydrate ABC transporter membrane protein 2, CUT1 family n=1 Tax=Paramicrobacterium humi TaxID=640635 RepID=A0A1H4J5K7_9MICO|nr:carbohydrate ABC transporter permease [Microbacterium humi]SEB41487.1 carbohydrate ABC transporter membrane protein 2, CUT1 family [Microbacterium humi]